MPNGASSSFDPLVVFLKLLPFVFALILDTYPLSYEERWRSAANDYFSEIDVDWGNLSRQDIEGNYKHLVIYINDKLQTEYVLGLSFLYAVFLHVLAIYTTGNWVLAVPATGFVGLLVLGWLGVDRWFVITEEGRNPDRYYTYYYEKKENDRIRRSFVNHLLPVWIDREISPKRYGVIAEILLIISVLGLELGGTPVSLLGREFGKIPSAFWISISVILFLLILGYFVTPGYRP